jgi:hypothetical protein
LENWVKAVAIAETVGIGVGAAALLLGAGGLALERQYRRRPGNDLELTPGEWKLEVCEPERYLLVGLMEFRNRTKSLEIMLPSVTVDVSLLSKGSLEGVKTRTKVVPLHKEEPARDDDYWFAYIVKTGKTTQMKVAVEIKGPDLSPVHTAWIRVSYVTYGPGGRVPKVRHVVVPLKYPDASVPGRWRTTPVADVMPVKTHLLTELDEPAEIVNRYVLPHAQKGDIVTIAESPVAIMQGRFIDPATIKPGFVAKRLCYFFMPTSSLATACGMQSLVDLVGPMRVIFAFVAGTIAKVLLRKPGVFYQLAGEQARLIDDVTGTLPPYDQFIVLGPENPQQVVEEIKEKTGLSAAIVDVNDLKAVKVLAATRDISPGILEEALRSNPAGNANEQTPVVLIRPNP